MSAADKIASRRLLVHWLRRQGNRPVPVSIARRHCAWFGRRSGALQALDALVAEGVGQWEVIQVRGGRRALAFRLLPDKAG